MLSVPVNLQCSFKLFVVDLDMNNGWNKFFSIHMSFLNHTEVVGYQNILYFVVDY